jgi:hypothetical protein
MILCCLRTSFSSARPILSGKEIVQPGGTAECEKGSSLCEEIRSQAEYGSGPNRKQGWVNNDLSPEADPSLDMRERMPFADGSATIILLGTPFRAPRLPTLCEALCAKAAEYWNLAEFFF